MARKSASKEIVVTPEMIAAGIKVFSASVSDDFQTEPTEQIVYRILHASLLGSPSKRPHRNVATQAHAIAFR